MREINGHVYKVINNKTNQIYIGAVIGPPDKYENYFGSGRIITDEINKYGITHFTKKILFNGITDLDELNYLEEACISVYKSTIEDGNYNIIINGGTLHLHSLDSKFKLSNSLLNSQKFKDVMSSDDHRNKMSIAMRSSEKFQKIMRSKEHSIKLSNSIKNSEKFQTVVKSKKRNAKLSKSLRNSKKFKTAMVSTERRNKLSKSLTNREITISHRHNISKSNGTCITLIPPNSHWIKEPIIDNSIFGICDTLNISAYTLLKYANYKIERYHLLNNTKKSINTISWTLISITKKLDITKKTKFKIYEIIKLDGTIDTPITFSMYCKTIGASPEIFIKTSGRKVTNNDTIRSLHMKNFIGWQCNIYEIDESDPNNVTKTLIPGILVQPTEFIFPKIKVIA